MTLGPQSIGIGPQGIGGGGSSENSARRETVLSAASAAVNQQPSSTDTPIQLEFGVAQGGVNDPIQIDATGNITINETDTYYFDILLAAARTGGASNSNLYGRLLIDGTQVGSSVFTLLDDDDVVIPLEFNTVMPLTAGQVMSIEIYRDSAGNNSGGVFAGSPSLAGWSDAPCCSITVGRLVPSAGTEPEPTEQRSNYVLVKQKSDFPNPSGGVITLASNTDYEINGAIDLTGDRIELNGSNVIFGQNPELDILLTSNATSLIEGRDSGMISDRLTFSNSTGPIFDVADTVTLGTNNVFVTGCVINTALSVGTFKDLQIVQFEKSAFQSLSNGVTIDGADNVGLRFDGNIVENTVTGTLINLGASVSQAISLDHNFIESSAGLVFLDGASGGANIAASGQGSIIANTTFGGNLPAINGITTADLKWQFDLNNTIPDSDRIGSLYMTSNIIPTAFTGSGIPSKVAGLTSSGATIQRFTMTDDNELTYDDTKTFNSQVTYSVSVARSSGSGNRLVRFYIYKNGVALTGATQALEVDNRERAATIITTDVTTTGDVFELWMSNEDNDNDMTVTELNCSITR